MCKNIPGFFFSIENARKLQEGIIYECTKQKMRLLKYNMKGTASL